MAEFKEKLLTHFRTSCRGLSRLRQNPNESPVKSPVILRASQPPAAPREARGAMRWLRKTPGRLAGQRL